MMKTSIGPVAHAILRQIGILTHAGARDRQKPMLIIEAIRVVDWASLTFVGQRHAFDLRLEGDADDVAAAVAAMVHPDLDNWVAQPVRVEALSIRD